MMPLGVVQWGGFGRFGFDSPVGQATRLPLAVKDELRGCSPRACLLNLPEFSLSVSRVCVAAG